MKWWPVALGGLALLALRAARSASAQPASRVIRLPQIDIVGRVPAGQDSRTDTPGVNGRRRPLRVRFDVRLSGMEKWIATQGVVRQTVEAQAQAGVLPGTGRPRVSIADVSDGYVVTIDYPDSYDDVSAIAAQRAIEGLDPRLEGRIANVVVDRA